MAEFCKECYLRLNPELSERDLVMLKTPDLCEGCGKIVKATVLNVKKTRFGKIKQKDVKL